MFFFLSAFFSSYKISGKASGWHSLDGILVQSVSKLNSSMNANQQHQNGEIILIGLRNCKPHIRSKGSSNTQPKKKKKKLRTMCMNTNRWFHSNEIWYIFHRIICIAIFHWNTYLQIKQQHKNNTTSFQNPFLFDLLV